MHTKEEVKKDLARIRALMDELEMKYGPEFCCALSVGAGVHTKVTSDDEPDAYAGLTFVVGNEDELHQACHALLESPKFINSFFDAVECVMVKRKGPTFLNRMIIESIESMKRLLIMETKHYKEHDQEVDDAIRDLLKQSGFTN